MTIAKVAIALVLVLLPYRNCACAEEPLKISIYSRCCLYEAENGSDPFATVHRHIVEHSGLLAATSKYVGQPRVWQSIDARTDACTIDAIKTPERLGMAYFSEKPSAIYPPLRLIVRPEVAQKLGRRISLSELVRDGHFRIAVAKGRSYGDEVAALIKSHRKAFFLWAGDELSGSRAISLLRAGRVDGVLEFSLQVDFWLAHQRQVRPGPEAELARLEVEELSPLLGFFACAKTDTGRRAIDIINASMATPAMRNLLWKAHMQAFASTEKTLITQLFQNYFGNTGQP